MLLCNPTTLGLYLRDGSSTDANTVHDQWLNRYLNASQWQLQRAWTSLKADRDWNILYHVGGNGPWIQKIDGVVQEGLEPPSGCQVEQVQMMSRHAERYPTTGAGGRMLALLERIKEANITLKGDLAFVDYWTYFSDDPQSQHDQLTTTGPYAGSLSAFRTGTKLRTRYRHLLPTGSDGKVNFWASSTKRVVETARYFATGLFGLDWTSEKATLHIIPGSADLGANTLTPQNTCPNYRSDTELGHDYGYTQLAKFSATYLPAISARFQLQNPGILFTNREIYSMQEICGFETLVRGSSPWCDVFTHEDWRNFEYARDVIHHYRAGPGNRFGATMGWLWLNATANLLEKGPEAGKLFFSFVHDGDIVPMLSALDVFHSPSLLPITHRDPARKWRLSQVTPMSGRIIFERLTCTPDAHSITQPLGYPYPHQNPLFQQQRLKNSTYIRIDINDGIVALPNCTYGPGSSCPLTEFLAHVKRRGEEVGDFRILCGLGEDVPGRVEFLHQ